MFTLEDGREHLFQWDTNRRIIVDDDSIDEVHFCNKTDTCSLVVEVKEIAIYNNGKETAKARVAEVPNILLQTDFPIRVYAYLKDGYTKVEHCFKVKARTKPADYAYTETELKNYDTLNNKIDDVEANLNERIDDAFAYVDETNALVLGGVETGKGYVVAKDALVGTNLHIEALPSKNLITYPFTGTTKTEGGITFTDNGDGTITLTGTLDSYSEITLGRITIKESGNYFLSGCPEGGGTSSYCLIANNTKNWNMDIDSGFGVGFYANAGDVYDITITPAGAPTGFTYDGITFKPQLELGEAATEFEVGRVIEGAEVELCGKNVLDVEQEPSKISSYWGVNITEFAKVVGKNAILSIKLKEGKELPKCYFGFIYDYYNTDKNIVQGNAVWMLQPSGLNTLYTNGAKLPADTWHSIIGVGVYGVSGLTSAQAWEVVKDAFDIQLEVGTYVTEYEPYVGATSFEFNEKGMINTTSTMPTYTVIQKDGIGIKVTYHKDLQSTVERLEQAILALGGKL